MASLDSSYPSVSKWSVELPNVEAKDSEFGGCRSIESNYHRDKQIGEGTYGEVYLATDLLTKDKVALKKIRMDNEKEGFPITAIREIKLLKRLENENVIRLKEIVRSQAFKTNNMKGSIYMVFDYMDHDLTGLMERRNYKMDVSHIKCYMKQLLKGLNYCHLNNILHRDLKASNLLVNNSGCLKIGDFGLARTKDATNQQGRLTNRVITLWYRPPELILGATDYGPEIDIWSVGCIFAELLAGQPLFPGKDEADQLERICKIMGSPTEQTMPGVSKLAHFHMLDNRYKENRLKKHLQSKKITDPHALDLLSKLLALDPKKRISAFAAADHEYFWAPPEPAKPEDLPKYADSHELDMKKLRQDGKRAAGSAAVATAGHDAKRPRHAAPGAGSSLEPHHHRNGQQSYDGRAHAGYRQGQVPRQEAWDARGGGYGDRPQSSSGRPHDGGGRPYEGGGRPYDGGGRYPSQQPPVPANAYPGAAYPGYGGASGGYGAPQPSYPAAYLQQPLPGGAGLDASGHPLPGHHAYQAFKGHAPQQKELGSQPQWAVRRR